MLAPLVQREIHYRLLTSDQAGRLRQLASVGSQSHFVARAIEWLKANYTSPVRIEELTAMSPLQYQKWLRLNEARRLMLNEGFDAASAGFEVGYESPSQFSRGVRPTLRRTAQARRGRLAEQGRPPQRSPSVTP